MIDPSDSRLTGLDFLRENGARRIGTYGDQPTFYSAANDAGDEDDTTDVSKLPQSDQGYEVAKSEWCRISVQNAASFAWDDALMPKRFVDGKDVGRVVAYVSSPEGYPVPIRLSQIGAIALHAGPPADLDLAAGMTLRVQERRVEKVVSLMADLFPWEEIEQFAIGLQAHGFRLLISKGISGEDTAESKKEAQEADIKKRDMHNFLWLQENVRYRTREEMFRLERRLASVYFEANNTAAVTITDGRLDDKEEIVRGQAPLVGLVKTHSSTSYLHKEGWSVVYDLRPAERSPAIALTTEKLELLTWYVRLCDGNTGPLDGIVRVEVSRQFFEGTLGGDFDFLNRLSRSLCSWRTRDAGYGRSGVTLYPIQQAEDRMGAHFSPMDTVVNRFYKLSGL